MLRWRLISAIAIIAVLAGACWLDFWYPLAGRGGLWLLPLCLAAAALASIETARLVFPQGTSAAAWLLAAGNVLIVAAAALPALGKPLDTGTLIGNLGWPLLAFILTMAAAFAVQMRGYQSGERTIGALSLAALALAYIGVLMSFLVVLRFSISGPAGLVALLSLIIVIKLADIGAYFVGRAIGGRVFGSARLAPSLSPKKTFEGAIGALAAGCLGSWLALAWLAPALLGSNWSVPPWPVWLSYGIVLSLAGMFGDLAESLLKREAGAKDSGHLPGLGGVLDLFDSILFAAPVACLFWSGVLAGL